jgi:DnaK suppressor protein
MVTKSKPKMKASKKKAAKLKSKKSPAKAKSKKKASAKTTATKTTSKVTKAKKTTKPKVKSTAKKTSKKTIKPTKKSKKSKSTKPAAKKVVKSTKTKVKSTTKKTTKKLTNQINDITMDIPAEINEPVITVSHGGDLSVPGQFQPYNISVQEDYMNDQQLQHFESILKTWKKELMLEVDNTISEMKEADILADPNDRATQEETFNLELRTRDRERKLIKKIDSALHKITEHSYGYCDSCGVEIGVRRLEARPTATLCIECKTLAEIREKRA